MLYATVRQRKIHIKNPTTVIQNGVGVDQIVLDMDDEWKDMTSIVCVFQNGETKKEKLHIFGQLLEVPWECLTETGRLTLSCTGYVGGEKVMTTMCPESFWNVVQNGPVTGDVALEPTPTLYEQVLDAAAAANAAVQQLLQDQENGVFDGKDGITPHIGANGNWYLGETDTGVKAQGEDGGYYTPVVSQTEANTMTVSFAPSKMGMGLAPEPKAITLPAGKDYVLTDADKQKIAALAAQLVDVPDSYTKAEIDAIMGSYITDIDTLVGGDA